MAQPASGNIRIDAPALNEYNEVIGWLRHKQGSWSDGPSNIVSIVPS